MEPQVDRLELPMGLCQLKDWQKWLIKWKDGSIGSGFTDSILPWGGAVLVWIEETTDAMIRLAGSVVCSCTLADVSSRWGSSGWGSSCGWGGDGTCCIWASEEEGDDSTGIGDLGGGGGVAVIWRFACDLVLLEPFLFGWLDWGHRQSYFWSLPMCRYADTTMKSLWVQV